jgi:hypothetical protein
VRFFLTLAAITFPAVAQTSATTAHPNFEGIWNSSTATPIERQARFKDKEFYTPQDVVDVERNAAAQQEDRPLRPGSTGFGGTYNAAFREPGQKVLRSLRTSIITDPPDGRIPPLTLAAAAEKLRHQESIKNPKRAQDFGLQDRCIEFPTAVPPMVPYGYNSNYQIVQTEGALMINVEMPHDTRVIHLDGRAHLPQGVRLWLGDSVGHWEGSMLVVDTTNFKNAGGNYGEAGNIYGYDGNLHVVERFSLADAKTILYRFEVDDPTAFTRPWKGELTMARSTDPIYEYACHEGNYALPNLLNIFRGGERSVPGTPRK